MNNVEEKNKRLEIYNKLIEEISKIDKNTLKKENLNKNDEILNHSKINICLYLDFIEKEVIGYIKSMSLNSMSFLFLEKNIPSKFLNSLSKNENDTIYPVLIDLGNGDYYHILINFNNFSFVKKNDMIEINGCFLDDKNDLILKIHKKIVMENEEKIKKENTLKIINYSHIGKE